MGNGTITMTGAEYDALAGKIAPLEAENAKLRAELEEARGLLRHASSALGIDGWESLSHEIDTFLTATPSATATVPSVNQQLLEALEGMMQVYGGSNCIDGLPKNITELELLDEARAAIAAARKEGGKV